MRRRAIWAAPLAAGAVVWCALAVSPAAAWADAPSAEAAPPAEVVSKKRAAPAPVKPVVHAGVRYSAGRAGQVRATKVDGGALLWEVQVYGLQGDPALETDKREVDITALRLDASRTHLLVRNAMGQRFRVALSTRQVTPAP